MLKKTCHTETSMAAEPRYRLTVTIELGTLEPRSPDAPGNDLLLLVDGQRQYACSFQQLEQALQPYQIL